MSIQDFYDKVSQQQKSGHSGDISKTAYRKLRSLRLETVRRASELLSWGEWRSEVTSEG